MTRIISGAAGGRRLRTPGGAATRPTSERVREALFSRLEHLDAIAGARVLDLYAGSGALGLEAVSRGAAEALLVESGRGAATVARANAAAVAPQCSRVRADTVERVLLAGPGGAPYDLVLLDPPYELSEDDLADVLALLVLHGWLAADALVVLERSARSPEPRWTEGLGRPEERRYGETKVWFSWYEPVPSPDEVA